MGIIKFGCIIILCISVCFILFVSIGLLRVHQYRVAAKPEVYNGPEIHQVALAGDLEKVQLLLSQDVKLINAQDKYGNIPLHLAALKGHTSVVELLIAKGADVNAKNKYGGTPLYVASYAGREQVVKILIDHGADVNVAMKDPQNQVLQIATMEGYRDYSHMFSALGGIINLKVHFIGSPLQAAAANGYKTIAEILIANGAGVNAVVTGNTALHSAAVNGQKELVELFIAKGADVDVKNENCHTPLFSAMFWSIERRGRQIKQDSLRDVVDTLIKKGANVNVKDIGGRTPFHYAAAFADKETVELLIAAGADINARDMSGDTPLNLACRYRSKRRGGVIDLIHKHGGVRKHGKNNRYDYEPDLIGSWP
jgi:cytohesin